MIGWQEIADRLGVELCMASSGFEDCPMVGRYTPMHLRGLHDLGTCREGTIHWRNRRWSRRGEYNFLCRIADGQSPRTRYPWLSIYHRSLRVEAMAKELGFRYPRDYTDEDRARLLALLGEMTPRERVMDSDQYTRALRWAIGLRIISGDPARPDSSSPVDA